jgi:hypothetical protein
MKKSEILRRADYQYNFDRDLWVNPKVKKAFSIEFVDDKPKTEIEFVDDKPKTEIVSRIEESTNGNGWTFYFNMDPSDGVKRVLEEVLG